jgi:hypothetical protein
MSQGFKLGGTKGGFAEGFGKKGKGLIDFSGGFMADARKLSKRSKSGKWSSESKNHYLFDSSRFTI